MFESDSSSTILSYGFEEAEGVRGTAETFLDLTSETLLEERPPETDPDASDSDLEGESRSLVSRGGGAIKSSPDVNSVLRMRVQHRGYATGAELVAAAGADPAVWRWLIRNKERTDPAMGRYIDSLFFTVDRGDDIVHLIQGAKATVATWRIVEGKHVEFEQAFLFARDTELGDPIADAGNNAAFTGKMYARGMRNDPDSPDSLFVEITTAGALDGTARGKMRKGAAGALGPEFAIVNEAWAQGLIENGEDPGNPESHEMVEVMFRRGAVGDVLTVGDTFEIPSSRTMAVPVYSTSRSLTAVGARGFVTIGGVEREYAIHDATIVYTRPMRHNGGIGSKAAFGIIPEPAPAKQSCTITLSRDYTDLDFYRALTQEYDAAFRIPMLGDLIRTGYREKWQLDIAHSRVTGAGAQRAYMPETVTARAFRPRGATNPLLLETIENTITTL